MKSSFTKWIFIGVAAIFVLPVIYSVVTSLLPNSGGEVESSANLSPTSKQKLSAGQLYEKCVPCHGANGDGSEGYPTLNTLGKEKLASRLMGYKSGTYGSENNKMVMERMVGDFSDDDIARLAEYISNFKPNQKMQQKDKEFKQKKLEQQQDFTGISS